VALNASNHDICFSWLSNVRATPAQGAAIGSTILSGETARSLLVGTLSGVVVGLLLVSFNGDGCLSWLLNVRAAPAQGAAIGSTILSGETARSLMVATLSGAVVGLLLVSFDGDVCLSWLFNARATPAQAAAIDSATMSGETASGLLLVSFNGDVCLSCCSELDAGVAAAEVTRSKEFASDAAFADAM